MSGSGIATPSTAPLDSYYADWVFYSVTYGGTEISQTEFTRLMNQASAYIDAVTFGRAAEEEDIDVITKIKFAACAVAETLKKYDEGGDIQSERVGNHTVTYASTPTAQLSIEAKITHAAKTFLGNTDLMYRGFAKDEYGDITSED